MAYEENKPAGKTKAEKDHATLTQAYDYVDSMLEVIQRGYSEFNQNGEGKERTLKEFIDDSQKRVNAYVPSRESQGKEEWQANVFTPTTRNKVKALIAGAAKNPPEIAVKATNQKNQESPERAELVKLMVESSFIEGDQNPEVEMYFDGWDTAIQGTIVLLDDYIRIKNKVKVVTDYDSTTGEVEYDEVEDYVCDKAVSIPIPLLNFLVWNPYIRNIQDQPRVAWIDYKDEDEAEYEFGEFKNWSKVKDGSAHFTPEDTDTFFLKRWQERTKASGKKYEVVRLYDKIADQYLVILNGVILLDSPLLWGRTKKKFPFSKTIYEPFANSKLFWGNSLPNILMGEQDIENAFINSMTDKTFRTLNTPLLVGRINKDNFDLEDEWVDSDTKIYVEDVSQVTPMPISGVSQAEIAMLGVVRSGLENDSSDSVQSGRGGSGSTAREIVIANERAEELKGLFYTFMKDLWLQKYRLRALNLLSNYGREKVIEIVGEDGEKIIEKSYRSFRLDNTELSDGRRGTLRLDVVGSRAEQKRPYQLDVEEAKARKSGQPMEVLSITSNFLDEYEYGIVMLTDSLFQKSRALKMAEGQEKMKGLAALFPEFFQANKDRLVRDFLTLYSDSIDKYKPPAPPPNPMALLAQMGGQPGGQPGAKPGGQAMPRPGMGKTKSPTQIQNQGMGVLPQLAR